MRSRRRRERERKRETVGGRRGHRQRDNLTRVRPKKRRRNKKTMMATAVVVAAAAAAADELSGVDRKVAHFAKPPLCFTVQRRSGSGAAINARDSFAAVSLVCDACDFLPRRRANFLSRFTSITRRSDHETRRSCTVIRLLELHYCSHSSLFPSDRRRQR